MQSLTQDLTTIMADAFAACGFARHYGGVVVSSRPDLAQFQCNGALAAAKHYKQNPRQIAHPVVDALRDPDLFQDITLAGPGFINLTLNDAVLTDYIRRMAKDEYLGCAKTEEPLKILIDYGGANVAKPLHVGHLRAAIIGESLKRLATFLGHAVTGDVHLGDWGLQMGMVITEIERRQPNLPYFDPNHQGPYPTEAPVTLADLEEIYPTASHRAKADAEAMEASRQATVKLQQGHPGYLALWQHFVDLSIPDLQEDYAKLNVHFDLWLGESDAQPLIPDLIAHLRETGQAYESQGALVVDIAQADDKQDLTPLMLVKSDGAVLYSTTDLATIQQRMTDFKPDLILYVVDNRQSEHFRQVFRGAYKAEIAPETTRLEHAGFGTMNGKDGKPFKTRAGGVMQLKALIQMITDKACERLAEIEVAQDYDQAEQSEIARMVGMAALKFADLSNHRHKDYVFDLDRYSSFEGRTGPYLLYSTVRAKSILRKALADQGLEPGDILSPTSDIERDLLLKLTELPDILQFAFANRAPNHLAEYTYLLGNAFNRFYHEHHILRQEDPSQRAAWLGLTQLAMRSLICCLDLLGIEVPERM